GGVGCRDRRDGDSERVPEHRRERGGVFRRTVRVDDGRVEGRTDRDGVAGDGREAFVGRRGFTARKRAGAGHVPPFEVSGGRRVVCEGGGRDRGGDVCARGGGAPGERRTREGACAPGVVGPAAQGVVERGLACRSERAQ